MKLLILHYLIVIVFFILVPSAHCQRKGKNSCKKFKLENGKVKVKSRGRLARLRCKKGYTMIDGDQFLSCVRKQWTGNKPKCIKSGCDTILEIAHGEAFELFQGALMQFTCSPGYALNGSPSLACDGTSWNASIPYCGHRTPHEEVELSCDFEDPGLCNWEIVNSPPNKGWKRGQGGPTMPGSSAPKADHSTVTQMGHFLVADADDMSTAGQMFSPVFTPPTEAPACFVLYYHIQNHATNGIRVSFKPNNISVDNINTSVVLRGDSGLPGDEGWTMYYFDLNPYIILEQHFQIILELLPGEGYNSDLAVDDVALASGSQCIEYELEYEEQQNPPTAFIKTTATSSITTEEFSDTEYITSTNQEQETTSIITTEESFNTEYITSTNQDQETETFQTISDNPMDITSIIRRNDLQNEELVSRLTTEITQEPNTQSVTITANNVTDKTMDETITYPNTQSTSYITPFQNLTDGSTTINHSNIITFGPKITIIPDTTPQVITILPPTTSTPLKQRTPTSTLQIATDKTLNPTTMLINLNNTKLPTKVPSLSTKPFISTISTALKYSTLISSTDVQHTITPKPSSESAFTPPPPPHLPPHPFSEIPTSTSNPFITRFTSVHLQTMTTEPSTNIQKVTTKAISSISSSDTLPTAFTSPFKPHNTTQKFTPPPPPPLPPHPFSEVTTTTTMLTTELSATTMNLTTYTENDSSNSFVNTTFSSTIITTQSYINNKTDMSLPITTSISSQPFFFTDTTSYATSTLPTAELNSQPTTLTVEANITSTTVEHLSTSTKNDIPTNWTTPKSTINVITEETSSISTKSTLIHTPEAVSTKIVTTTKPDITTEIIGETISPNVKNKRTKYSKGAIAAIAVLILVLCVLGIIAISVVVDKYKKYAKEDKLLEDSEGSNSSIRFSYRREGATRGGSGGGGGGDRDGQGEIRLPPVNFYGYENPGTPV